MEARFRSWWQKIRHRKIAIVVSTAITMVAVVLIKAGYSFDVTGFNGYTQVSTIHILSGPTAGTVTRTEVYQPGKTLWDWLQLLVVPLALAVIALLFNFISTRTEQKMATKRYEHDKQIADERNEQEQKIAAQRYERDQLLALDKQREDLLQAYLNHMSELLLKEHLLSSAPIDEVRNIARVRTITTLFQLDARRIGYVYTFLRESVLMSNNPNGCIVSLRDTDLDNINFSLAKLNGIDLTGASLIDADLSSAMFASANLSDTTLRNANLSGAKLMNTKLMSADLSGAILFESKLSKADLFGAFLAGADLLRTDITEEQLKNAKSLTGATMPDGSKHP